MPQYVEVLHPVAALPPKEEAPAAVAKPSPEASTPPEKPRLFVPPQPAPESRTEARPVSAPNALPKVADTPLPLQKADSLVGEADQAIRDATIAAAAAVARFAREGRTATRNAEYTAGDQALARARKHLAAAQYTEARDQALEASRRFTRAKPEAWEQDPIVIRR